MVDDEGDGEAVEVEALVEHCLTGRQHGGEVGRLAAGEHRAAGDALERRLTASGWHAAERLRGVAAVEHHLDAFGRRWDHGQSVAEAEVEQLLELIDGPLIVFRDPRMFGVVRWHDGPDTPAWWNRIAPNLLSPAFTHAALDTFLTRRARASIKAALLMQERFPGIGNWMADEILWRAALHPARLAGTLAAPERRTLYREIRQVCRLALKHIAGTGGPLPPDLNIGIPDTWLFKHRWADGGTCPKTRTPLQRAEIGGRTTCWSTARQRLG